MLQHIAVSTFDRRISGPHLRRQPAAAAEVAERPAAGLTDRQWHPYAVEVGPGPAGLRMKRGMDIVLTGILLVPGVPMGAVIAVLIKRGSPGPAFFRQVRVGQDGRRFEILKFRTMVHGADARRKELTHRSEADGLFKIKEDPRLTPVGMFLRQSYLDELPQLLNVLRGEMSLVGPRPLIVDEDAAITGSGRHRLRVPPGMTGEWQLLGGGASLDEMIAVDYRYVAEWSLLRDIRCLIKTAIYVIARKGW